MQNEDKSDVYDIGVILLEIIVGRPIMSQNEVFVANDLVSVNQNLAVKPFYEYLDSPDSYHVKDSEL